MIEFLSNYGLVILEIVISIVCLLVYLLKKNKIILKDTAFEKLLSKLPGIIAVAEEYSSDGQEKKSFVLGVAYSFLADLLGEDPDVVAERYGERISEAIEKILETPQKKGVNND